MPFSNRGTGAGSFFGTVILLWLFMAALSLGMLAGGIWVVVWVLRALGVIPA